MIAVVIPSNRPASLERWEREWAHELSRPDVRLYKILDQQETWDEIRDTLGTAHYGGAAWIIPRKTDCIRSYGYWKAWRDGAEIIWTVDDDCYPDSAWDDALDIHSLVLKDLVGPRWCNTVTGFRPRGMPQSAYTVSAPLVLNHGLWSHVPDVDAETQLLGASAYPLPHVPEAEDCQYIPQGQFFPMSGMNLAFRRELTPAMYFGLMGTMLMRDLPWGYDRFGDIWAGLMAKKICDHLGWAVRSGSPWVRHERASDPHVNLVKEAAGKIANEWLWQAVDSVRLTKTTVVDCYDELADGLGEYITRHRELPGAASYFRSYVSAMHVWASLFRNDPLHTAIKQTALPPVHTANSASTVSAVTTAVEETKDVECDYSLVGADA